MQPRIPPIEKPKGIFQKIMYALMKRELGKVIMPAKVIYSRYPQIGMLVKKLYDVESSFKLVSGSEKLLIQNLVATLNGCTFCMDMSMKKSIDQKIGLEKFYDLLDFRNSENYSLREKAVYSYVQEMTEHIVVRDEIYEEIKRYCSDEEIIEITYIAASENYLNRLIKPLNIGSDALCEVR